MTISNNKLPNPFNEPIKKYLLNSEERKNLENQLDRMLINTIDIPVIIGGKEYRSDNTIDIKIPHNHKHTLGKFHKATKEDLLFAADNSLEAHKEWSEWPFQDRISIFLRVAEQISGSYRAILNAATMLGQSKNIYQAEIDSACELIDFFRFNSYYYQKFYEMQPKSSSSVWNRLEYRPLEGFILAITPFNFVSIAGNLPTVPVLAGNVSLWKPASNGVFPAYYLMKLFMESGLPPGVINFIPSEGNLVGEVLVKHKDLAGIHFTGSTKVFHQIYRTIGENIENYKNYPRIVGETGGKDFIFVHNSANVDELVTAMLRGSFEYQGQKCSASSRAYIPESLFNSVLSKLEVEMKHIKMGDVTDYSTFLNAVIDESAYDSIVNYIKIAEEDQESEIILGGKYDKSKGYFIEPTIVKTTNPKHKLMEEEIFGPVLTLYIYPDNEFEKSLELCDQTSIYALTGSIFAKDQQAIQLATKKLRYSAGNFYINDKPTGAVVGQQPFGGARASGTNDKAGGMMNPVRWMSVRTIKENFNPPKEILYQYMKS